MNTASQVETMVKQVEADSSAGIASAALLGAIGAALLLVLGAAWFASGAGADYPEPVAAVAD